MDSICLMLTITIQVNITKDSLVTTYQKQSYLSTYAIYYLFMLFII